MTTREYIETVVIGGGQAGLNVGYQLQKAGGPFAILDAHERVGDAWRKRWDSLQLLASGPRRCPASARANRPCSRSPASA